ncbi:hypothetical protein RhiirC2_721030 [Rhizophagus irregularis]|uniref:NrS-1 polymerase-like helicase domain-containing protein n=1 Tax=Rhizophagus irregularis TaxID=588596 RepID=A0A2N1M7Z1_9GLOM|nr:hypothetical protein RhiirC2_721030 [Rhizophagus irregularis]
MEINKEIMDPILWHVQNIICDANEELNEYIWNWWAYLVQKPEKKPRSILVLKSTLQQCGKNIITDFIGDKVLGPHLHFATSDLEKILGKFNSPLQGRKLIVLNETGMSSGDWHKFNSRLKDFITTGRVDVERKGLETLRLRDFSGWMKYLEWCGENGEKPFSNNIAGKKFSDISIESKQARTGGRKREWQYILDRSKIVAKLRESDLGDMEEFSEDTSQDDLSKNETTDIPIFNVLEIILQKIIPPQPVKSMPSPSTKVDKQDGGIQDLFDYVAEQVEAPVASTSGTSETSKRPESSESEINKPETSKPPESVKPISEVANISFKENVPINQVSSDILMARTQ